MDGNRRWSKVRGLSYLAGYKKGAKILKNTVLKCINLGIKELTVFAFSTENFNRTPDEVKTLLGLLEYYLKSEIAELNYQKINLNIIGKKSSLNNKLLDLFSYSENLTKHNTGMKFNVAINYGGKFDIIHTIKKISSLVETKKISIDDIDETLVYKNLLSSKVKNIDLLIRTSGEQRISNFMFWQLAYSELYFTDVCWPDFSDSELDKALSFYNSRQRSFGSSLYYK